jgi:hypothetical protein
MPSHPYTDGKKYLNALFNTLAVPLKIFVLQALHPKLIKTFH